MNLLKKNYDTLSLTAMALPGILFFFLFGYLPLFGLILAFKEYNALLGFVRSPWIGFENFRAFLGGTAGRVTFNTLYLNTLFIVVSTVIQVTFAIMLSQIVPKLAAKIFQSVMFIPHFISWVVVGYFSLALFNSNMGLMNGVLSSLGMEKVHWFVRPEFWPPILLLFYLWKHVGYGSVIYLAAITGIDQQYYEAAKVDGASRMKQTFYITIPLIMPIISILTLLAVGRIMYADFGLFYYVPNNTGPLYRTTDVLDTYIYRALRVTGDIGISTAANFFQSIVGFGLVLVTNLIARKVDTDYALY